MLLLIFKTTLLFLLYTSMFLSLRPSIKKIEFGRCFDFFTLYSLFLCLTNSLWYFPVRLGLQSLIKILTLGTNKLFQDLHPSHSLTCCLDKSKKKWSWAAATDNIEASPFQQSAISWYFLSSFIFHQKEWKRRRTMEMSDVYSIKIISNISNIQLPTFQNFPFRVFQFNILTEDWISQ